LMAFIIHPFHERLARLTGRPTAMSVLTVLVTAGIIVGTVVEFGSLFLARALVLANLAREQMRPGGALAAWIDAMTGWLARFGLSTASLTTSLPEGWGGRHRLVVRGSGGLPRVAHAGDHARSLLRAPRHARSALPLGTHRRRPRHRLAAPPRIHPRASRRVSQGGTHHPGRHAADGG